MKPPKDLTIEEALEIVRKAMEALPNEPPPINRRALLERYEDEWQLEAGRPKNLNGLR